ncbi:MAG TPA: entericidin A/B family lipoprotein [Burkholderiales bacterium]|jgi:predicted small secreted protein|nr:entericidin A/B family lipoprotein [Burkholderiales bacterium]HEX5463799.1 entericidin A/B family lipoprotein [Burkholderiales bacterium]
MGKYLMLVAAVLMTVALSACNTVNGMGKDISNAGQDIQKAAK